MTQVQELNKSQSDVYTGIRALFGALLQLHSVLPEEPWLDHVDAAVVKLSQIAGTVEQVAEVIHDAPVLAAPMTAPGK